jgi:hypothetical protein
MKKDLIIWSFVGYIGLILTAVIFGIIAAAKNYVGISTFIPIFLYIFLFIVTPLGILLVHWEKRREHKKWLKQLIKDSEAGTLPKISLEKPENGVIGINENGFHLTIDRRKKKYEEQVKWNEVEEIVAFKRDLFAYDLICLGFKISRDYNTIEVEVNEHMLGFDNLMKAVENQFGVRNEDWFRQVAVPAFAVNMTTIWPKKENTERVEPLK